MMSSTLKQTFAVHVYITGSTDIDHTYYITVTLQLNTLRLWAFTLITLLNSMNNELFSLFWLKPTHHLPHVFFFLWYGTLIDSTNLKNH